MSEVNFSYESRLKNEKFIAEKLWESEESLRVLMNSNPEAVFILDTSGNFIAANEKTALRFGKPVEELIGTNVFSYLTPELAVKRKDKVDEVISAGKPVRFEDTRNGRYYDNYLHPVFDSEGNIIRIAVWVVDFTERKLAVDALKSSEEKFRELAENIPEIFWIRKEDEMLYVSPAYEIICGKSCESLYKEPNSFLQSIHPEDIGRVMNSFMSEQYLKDGLFDEEFRIIRSDGIVKWIWSKTFPVFKDGAIVHTVGIAEDISLRKEYEEKIRRALVREKELNDLKSRFVSMVSHEFRTPLGLILSSAELLQNYGYKWSDQKRNEQFEKIKKAVDNLTGLMNDIIILSQEETGSIKISLCEIHIAGFLHEIIDEVTGSSNNNSAVHFLYNEDPVIIISDKKLLRQIFLNLIGNAVKFTPPGKNIYLNLSFDAEPGISAGDSNRPKKFKVEIKDEGIGIPGEDLDKIFEPFNRAKNADEIRGSGLGLSIVKRAVDLLHGEITVESKLNEGTAFSVILPVNQLK
ncbi:MAG TPA: PAS domain-containing sensor histidine kinase [Ignavibacteriaceae bacterium]|nr:PAS domain-containing sensor histidine kinase [Ignavibacteriaceae bacterium]